MFKFENLNQTQNINYNNLDERVKCKKLYCRFKFRTDDKSSNSIKMLQRK